MADVLAVRDEYRAQTWAMLIQECNNSGLTKREFCQQRGISEKIFYYWLRKLRSQMAEAAGPQLVPLDAPVISDIVVDGGSADGLREISTPCRVVRDGAIFSGIEGVFSSIL